MQFLAWNDYLKTGIEIVDQQHRGLLQMANEATLRIVSPEGISRDEIFSLIEYLLDYSETHFSTEEALMALSSVDERHAEHHRESHLKFLRQVQDMAAELAGDSLSPQSMMEFLGNWLVYHMLGEDRAMGRQIKAIGRGLSPEDAYEQRMDSPADPAQAAATQSLSRLYAFMARRNESLRNQVGAENYSRHRLAEIVAQRTAELEASEERFSALFMNGVLPTLILSLDRDLLPEHITDANPAACDLLGYGRPELLALAPGRIVAPEEVARFPSMMTELLTTGRFQCEMVHASRTGRRIRTRSHMIHFMLRGRLMAVVILEDLSSSAPALAPGHGDRSSQLARVRSDFLANLGTEVSLPPQGVLGLMRPDDIGAPQAEAFFARLPLFQDLLPEDMKALANGSRERRLTKGEILFHKGDRPRGLYLVIGGQVKQAISSVQGNEKVLGIFGPCQTFGEAEVFMDQPYPYFAQALSEVVVLQLGQTPLLEVAERDPSFSRRLLAHVGERMHSLVQDVESYTLRSGTDRVIGYLLQHAYIDAEGRMKVELPARKQVVASLLHLTPETLSRIFHDLSEGGLITVKGRQVQIPDAERLTAHQGAEQQSTIRRRTNA